MRDKRVVRVVIKTLTLVSYMVLTRGGGEEPRGFLTSNRPMVRLLGEVGEGRTANCGRGEKRRARGV